MSEGVSATLSRLSSALLEHAHTRLALLRSEIDVERERLGDLLWRTVFTLFFAFLTIQVMVLFLVSLAWDTPWRVYVVGGIAVVSLFVTLLCRRSMNRCAEKSSSLFSASLAELEKDRRALEALHHEAVQDRPGVA